MGSGTYKIREGDTLSEIADKVGVSQKALREANNLEAGYKLKIGKVLRIPSASKTTTKNVSVRTSAGGYVVRNGENDWTIAHKFHLTVPQLKKLNPGVNFENLKIGTRLSIPGAKTSTVATATRRSSVSPKLVARGSYKVKSGDNDWIIAKRIGTTPKVLRQLNPGVNWNAVQIGQSIRIPGSSSGGGSTLVANKIPAIRSRHAVIKGDNVTLRRGPSITAEKVTSVDAGTAVTVLDKEGSWYKLRFPRGTEAWVRGDFIAPVKATVVARNRTSKSTRVASRTDVSSLNRKSSKPGKKTSRSGSPRYVASRLPSTGNNVLDTARGFLGTPYSYGSSSRGATDCSGFVGQVYRKHGVRLPRTSNEQSRSGQKVSRGNMKPGDLVFFHTRGSSRVNHVGIYMGNGKFIHASSGGGKVQVNNLSDGYYNQRFSTARRVANVKTGSKAVVVAKRTSKPKTEVAKAETSKAAPVATRPEAATDK